MKKLEQELKKAKGKAEALEKLGEVEKAIQELEQVILELRQRVEQLPPAGWFSTLLNALSWVEYYAGEEFKKAKGKAIVKETETVLEAIGTMKAAVLLLVQEAEDISRKSETLAEDLRQAGKLKQEIEMLVSEETKELKREWEKRKQKLEKQEQEWNLRKDEIERLRDWDETSRKCKIVISEVRKEVAELNSIRLKLEELSEQRKRAEKLRNDTF